MRTAKYCLMATLVLGMIANVYATRADDAAKPAHTIKEVMVLAHKKGLYNKVKGGNSSADDKKTLAELYADLPKNTPEKGDAQSWKAKSEALANAAKDVVDDKPNALASLKAANKCKDCHDAHK
jgi:hypothetical protein